MALTTEFVTSVRRQGSIPTTMTTADILAVGDEEIQARFVALLESVRQNYMVRELIATPDVRGKVPLPPRASGAAVRSVQLQVGGTWRSLPQRQMEDWDGQSTGYPDGYYLDAGSIVLLPTGTSGTLRIRYCARPSKMVDDSDGAKSKAITSVTPGPTTTTLVCGGYVGSTVIDIVAGGPAHQLKAINTTLTGSVSVSTADLLEGLIAGTLPGAYDCVCYPGTTPFVPLPEELFSALVHATAANILLTQGYLEEANAQEGKAQQCIEMARPMLLPRNEGNPQRVTGGLRRALGGGVGRRGW
jgi:hypothetical protein